MGKNPELGAGSGMVEWGRWVLSWACVACPPHAAAPQERRLADVENAQTQLREALQSLKLLPGTAEAPGGHATPLGGPCVNGDTP